MKNFFKPTKAKVIMVLIIAFFSGIISFGLVSRIESVALKNILIGLITPAALLISGLEEVAGKLLSPYLIFLIVQFIYCYLLVSLLAWLYHKIKNKSVINSDHSNVNL